MVEVGSSYCILAKITFAEGATGIPRRRWMDDIKTDILGLDREGVEWV
jgi:hypothetical protein